MNVKPLTEYHLEFLRFKVVCTGSSESTLVKRHIVGNHMSRLKYVTTTAILVHALPKLENNTAKKYLRETHLEMLIQ